MKGRGSRVEAADSALNFSCVTEMAAPRPGSGSRSESWGEMKQGCEDIFVPSRCTLLEASRCWDSRWGCGDLKGGCSYTTPRLLLQQSPAEGSGINTVTLNQEL